MHRAASLLLFLTSPAFAADAGLRILIQPWSPADDDDVPRRVLDDPAAISRAVHDQWASASTEVHDRLLKLLGEGELTLVEPVVSIEPVADRHARLIEELHEIHFATAECAVDFDLTATIPLALTEDPHHPFAVAPGAGPMARISNLRAATKGDCAAVGKGLAADLGIQTLDEPLAGHVGAALGGFDLDPGLPGLVVLNAWGGGDAPVTLALGVKGPVPDDGRRSALVGTMRSATSDGPLSRVVACEDLEVHGARKAGPRPILDADGALGEAPLEPVDVQITCGAPDENGLVRFTMSGLSATFPTAVRLGSVQDCDGSAPDAGRSAVRVRGLESVVLPGDLFQPHALVASGYLEPCHGGEAAAAPVADASR